MNEIDRMLGANEGYAAARSNVGNPKPGRRMAVVTWHRGRRAITTPPMGLMAAGALVALVRYKMNATWVVVAGALIGLVIGLLTA